MKKDDGPFDNLSEPSGLYASPQFAESELMRYENVPYSTRPNFMGIQFTDDGLKTSELQQNQLEMHLDIVVPPNAGLQKLQPLIVFIHGGGFKSGTKKDFSSETLSYATTGYISATLNYRLTVDNDLDSNLRTLAALHALEDVQNAIRFLKANSELFYIDTTRIAVSGGSAGGGLTLGIALGADEIDELTSDHPEYSAQVSAAFPTGATLIADSLIDFSYLVFDATDAPVMLFHNRQQDPATFATWEDALETQALIRNSGNECQLVPQPENTHTVSLHVGSIYWEIMKPFLWRHLRIYELIQSDA